ncbi:hypothetical protein TRFO_43225 [Tritrichomonas foetus]|uniref:Uncharacterized protein n=1 Tax=Tritrichomonas foetus TaxID=1144522 RepID=A0A1J4KRJ6_9EUKA|nr:hypothetical protein TRFO_43225 [Tritrichomonas foetus]|eukprot:OHT13887.1 hypothetical protein TRFO_43225 [Tritrichomonas foetus]
MNFVFYYKHWNRIDPKQSIIKINYDKGGKPLSKGGNGFRTFTNLFQFEDILLLLNILEDRYSLKRSRGHSNAPKRWKVSYLNGHDQVKCLSILMVDKKTEQFEVNIYSINSSMNYYQEEAMYIIRGKNPTMQQMSHNGRLIKTVQRSEICTDFLHYFERYINDHSINSGNPFFVDVFSEKTILSRFQDNNDLFTHINGWPGFKKFILRKPLASENMNVIRIADNVLKYFIWIDPSAKLLFESFTYLEIDASFKLFPHHTYSIFHVVLANVSVPLGFIIGKSESFELYETFFKTLTQEFGLAQSKKLPVLADLGTAIEAFVKHNQLIKYDCHRHIIEYCGSLCALGCIMTRLLRITSEDEYIFQKDELKKMLSLLLIDNPTIKERASFKRIVSMLDSYYAEDINKIADSPYPSDKSR